MSGSPRRDDRTYIKLHDGMPEHPKIEALSDAGFRAVIDLWCWCSRHLTDGKVSTAVWTKRVTLKVRRELLAAGLAHPTDDGVEMHDYLQHQRSAAEVAELKEKRREAGRKGGKAKASTVASAKASASHDAKQTASKDVAETETEVLLRNTLPNPTDSGTTSPEPSDINAGTVVGAWVEAIQANGIKPSSGQRGQVGKLAAELLSAGNDPQKVLDAAQVAGAKGWATIDRELTVLASQAQKPQQKLSYEERLMLEEIERNKRRSA